MAVLFVSSAFAFGLISAFSIVTFIVFCLVDFFMTILRGEMKFLLSLVVFLDIMFHFAYCAANAEICLII